MNDIPLFAAQEDFPSGGFFYVQEKGSRRSRCSGSGSKAEPDSLHLVGFFLAPAVLVPGDGAKPFQPTAFCGKGVEVASLTIHTIALIVFLLSSYKIISILHPMIKINKNWSQILKKIKI